MLGGAAATAATAAATGGASAAVNALPAGLKVALAHVPSWSQAYQILTQHLSAYGQNASTGAAGIGAALHKALVHGIAHAR